MKEFALNGKARTEVGKKATKELRKQGYVPCNLYGEKKGENGQPEAHAFAILASDLRKVVFTPHIYVINLNIDGEHHTAVLKELQFHPVTDAVLHVDFYEITETKPIVMEVPIKLNGLAEGVRAGGKLSANVRKLKVRAPYTAIPERLDIDVTGLALGKTIKVADLSFEGLEIMTSPSVVVCQVKMTRSAMSAASKTEDSTEAAAE